VWCQTSFFTCAVGMDQHVYCDQKVTAVVHILEELRVVICCVSIMLATVQRLLHLLCCTKCFTINLSELLCVCECVKTDDGKHFQRFL
jgi:hypothetical protein